ncbi:MAG: hypothetical protein NUV56_04625, partial [Candidatus Uhrbacteria bacterium]|nr:hypothetical protein [Candidatus Uhrbacteria bacterium]
MFGSKPREDRRVVELAIEFNLTAIGKWLADSGSIAEIEKMEKDWKDSTIRSYYIDVLPNGQTS